MVEATLCDLLVVPPVILSVPETVNGCDKLFYVMTRVLSSGICLLPLQTLLRNESHFFSLISKSGYRRVLYREFKSRRA